jgi:fucose permease
VLLLGFCGFFCLGVVLVLLGANQADLARDLDLDFARTGMLAAALAAGIGVGVVGAGPLFDRFARRPLFIAATLITGAGLLAFRSSTGFQEALLLIGLAGAGVGAYDTLFNAAVVERFGERSAKPMNLLHAATCLGAISGPPLVAAISARWHWAASLHWTGAAHIVLAAAALLVRFPAPARRPVTRKPVFSTALLPFAVIAFAYVGVESAVTMFAVPYASVGLALDPTRGQYAISALWFGILLGRLAPLALRGNLDSRIIVATGLLGGVGLIAGIALDTPHISLLFGCVGFAVGPVYPVMISLAGQRFPHSRGAAAGLAAGAGALGGFAIPWLTGATGDGFGISIAMGSLGLWALLIALGGQAARRSAARDSLDPVS